MADAPRDSNRVTTLLGVDSVGFATPITVAVDSTTHAMLVSGSSGGGVVTNAGTFAVQASLGAETTKVIGTINIAASQTVGLAAGAATIGALTANQSVNVAQMNGVTTSMGVGASGTGTQRIVTANDTGKTLRSTGGSAGSSGDNTLIAAGADRLKVYAFSLSTVSTTALTAIFQSGATGTELWRVLLQTPASVAGGANLVVQPPAWLFATASATLLNLNLSAAVTVHWSVSYYDEA